jgi:hypothetical protein
MDIVTTSNFHATLLPGASHTLVYSWFVHADAVLLSCAGLVSVVFVPAEHIRHGSWPLLKCVSC